MNKVLVIIIAIALVLILGFGVYKLVKAPNPNESNALPMAAGTAGENGFTTSSATTTE